MPTRPHDALEMLCGGTTCHKLAQRAAALLGAAAEEQKRAYDQPKGFFDLRSSIVHLRKPPPSPDVLNRELDAGCNLACLTLESLLNRDAPSLWADVMGSLLPETQSYIAGVRSHRDT